MALQCLPYRFHEVASLDLQYSHIDGDPLPEVPSFTPAPGLTAHLIEHPFTNR